MSLKEYLYQIYFLTGKNIGTYAFIVSLFILNTLLDLIGIGLISAYISLLVSPNIVNSFIADYNFLFFINSLENREITLYVGVFLIVIFLVKFLLSIFTYSIIVSFAHKTQRDVRYKILIAYQKLNYENYILKSGAESIAATGMYVKNYGAVLIGLLLFIGDVIVGTSIVLFLFYINGLVLLSMVIFLSLVIGLYKIFFLNQATYLGEKLNIGYKNMYQGIQEFFEGFKELRILNNYHFFEDKILSSTNLVAKSDIKQNVITFAPRYLIELAVIIFLVSIVAFASFFLDNMYSLIPVLSIFGAAAIRLTPMFNQITRFFGIFRFGQDSISKLYGEVCNLDNQYQMSEQDGSVNNELFQSLELNNISYTYPKSNNKILKNVSLKIDKGDIIGVIGPSGSGKTTLIDIILGLLTPQTGEILFNQTEKENYKKLLLNKVAYLPQDTFLINDSVEKNIALGLVKKDIDTDRISESVKKSQLDDFVEKLPDGIETIISEKGINISGGQKQRIALARAFYFDREILVFDESTSALDDKVESDIIDQIRLLKDEKTIILISHRNSTIKYCNKVYHIDRGSVKEL